MARAASNSSMAAGTALTVGTSQPSPQWDVGVGDEDRIRGAPAQQAATVVATMPSMREQAAEAPATPIRMSEVLGAFSLAADLAVGLHPEHATRSCYIGMHIAQALGLPVAERTH